MRTAPLDGEPWFVAADVCAWFGFDDHAAALAHLHDLDRRPGEPALISEPGVYELGMSSRRRRTGARELVELVRTWVGGR